MAATAHPLAINPARHPVHRLDRWCLSRLSASLAGAPVRVDLWNGMSAALGDPIHAAVLIHDRQTLWRLLIHPAWAFGEAYAAGRLTVRGDLVRMLEGVNRVLAGRPFQRTRGHADGSVSRSRHNVHAHYDLGNEFYRLWLDEQMVYTCAYFHRPDATLGAAQQAKLDYICRKLGLAPGERVIEAGCGWGALALHMARHYGVSVRAYNLSEPQLEYAREQAARQRLGHRVTFINGDYRAIAGRCDAFVSVGMLEHVGRAHYPDLGVVIDRVLDRRYGRGLLHFIGRNVPMPFNPWITRRIFPGAYAPTLAEAVQGVLEPWNLSVTDVENLRLHYARTLQHWLARFDDRVQAIRAAFDDRFVRTWRLYLASSQACFLSGDLQLFQVTFGRATDNTWPWTRASLYPPDRSPVCELPRGGPGGP
jgi:cyclopropane-fatty-acyl-phospholipid synthase